MKQGLTEIAFILDRSGSMHHLVDDTIGGFNSVIQEQREGLGEVYVTTVLFSDNSKILHDHINIKDVPLLTTNEYRVAGCTALLDAIGTTIDNIGIRLAETPEENRPSKVMVFITTDGQENASREYTKARIKEMIEHQTNVYNWTFVFLGANMDAVAEGRDIGITHSATYTASSRGVGSTYTVLDDTITAARAYADVATTACSVDALCSINAALDDAICAKMETIV